MNVQEARKQANELIETAIDKRVKQLKKTKAFKELKKQVQDFENDPYLKESFREFDEYGYFTSVKELDHSAFKDEDKEVVLKLMSEFESVDLEGYDPIKMKQCLGEAVIINFSDPRNCSAIHSSELELKVNYRELVGKDDSEKLHHGKLLIEKAMRAHGYFPNVVEVDYYGGVLKEHETLGMLDDAEIERQIKEIENSRE